MKSNCQNTRSAFSSRRALVGAFVAAGMIVGTGAAFAPATANATAKESRYTIDVGSAKGAVGKAIKVNVELNPVKPWHTNTEFPTKLVLKAPGAVKVAKAKLGKGDATVLSEQKIVFAVEVTPTKAGKHKITGDFKFAICKANSCSPAKAKFTINVDAKKK